jgi:hypothetical protein
LDVLTPRYTSLKQGLNDTVNCGVFCCVVAISGILDVEAPKTIHPTFWRRGLLELIGGKADDLHPESNFVHDPHSWSSPEVFKQQQQFLEKMIDHKNKIIIANSEAMKTVEKNFISMRDEFAKFYLTLRFSSSEVQRLRKVAEERSSGLDNMLSRMSRDIDDMKACWDNSGSENWFT